MATLSATLRRTAAALVVVTAGVSLAACSSDQAEEPDASGDAPQEESSGEWPRTFENADGTQTEIPAQPENILSTSVTATGTLLAIDAPVTHSGADGNGDFFAQWANIAEERGVESVWSAGTIDLEAALVAEPDLIVVAATGADSVADQVADLQDIAPVVVVDYGEQTWQDLAVELGEATGLEVEAAAAVEEFDALVDETAAAITVPEGEANIVSYNGAGQNSPIGRAGGAQGELLTSLGFTVEEPDAAWHTQPQERADFVFSEYEHLTELTAETTFILSADDAAAEEGFASDPVLANVPSVKAGQVYGLGLNSFRMDLYSATEVVEHIADIFG
ncbi:Fe2+-enterobactin ABC transporter substrate-binding protein [Microbacterium sp. gxy059]|uniref:Fe2+-enterobactin ABC transporter substrate-binding protein n=1 Tax=Microbacterium sp. gxy059 TaxID=2957199 RepID=UPI003D9520F5